MHPRFKVEREYAVRLQGEMTSDQMRQMTRQGIELEDGIVIFQNLSDEGGEGFNHWYRLVLMEGRNRVVRRTFEALGLQVSRLMRVRFGIINLPPRIKRGMMAELGEGEVKMILDWVGLTDQFVEKQMPPTTVPDRESNGKNRKQAGEINANGISKTTERHYERRGQIDVSRMARHGKIKTGVKR
jgi:23S rRNA pseudouridine2605 synthase